MEEPPSCSCAIWNVWIFLEDATKAKTRELNMGIFSVSAQKRTAPLLFLFHWLQLVPWCLPAHMPPPSYLQCRPPSHNFFFISSVLLNSHQSDAPEGLDSSYFSGGSYILFLNNVTFVDLHSYLVAGKQEGLKFAGSGKRDKCSCVISLCSDTNYHHFHPSGSATCWSRSFARSTYQKRDEMRHKAFSSFISPNLLEELLSSYSYRFFCVRGGNQ